MDTLDRVVLTSTGEAQGPHPCSPPTPKAPSSRRFPSNIAPRWQTLAMSDTQPEPLATTDHGYCFDCHAPFEGSMEDHLAGDARRRNGHDQESDPAQS